MGFYLTAPVPSTTIYSFIISCHFDTYTVRLYITAIQCAVNAEEKKQILIIASVIDINRVIAGYLCSVGMELNSSDLHTVHTVPFFLLEDWFEIYALIMMSTSRCLSACFIENQMPSVIMTPHFHA